MKKIFFVAIMAVMTVGAVSAQQKGDMTAGARLSYASGESVSNFGIGAYFQYNVTDPIRLEGSFNYFFPSDMGADITVNLWDFSANFQYLFPLGKGFVIYPYAGLGVQGFTVNPPDWAQDMGLKSVSETKFAFNLGAGADYHINDNWVANAQLGYKISDPNRFGISLGVGYKF